MKKLVLTLFLLAFSVLSSGKAFACVCSSATRPLSDKEIRAAITKEFDRSVAVFSGEVVEIDAYHVKFKIAKLWKGDPADEVIMSTGTVKIDENYSRSSSCDYRFKLNEKYLVYARKSEAGLVAYKCTGTNLLINVERDIRELDDLNPNAYQPPAPNAFLLRRNLTTDSSQPAQLLFLNLEWCAGRCFNSPAGG